jgi:hypothetical protein
MDKCKNRDRRNMEAEGYRTERQSRKRWIQRAWHVHRMPSTLQILDVYPARHHRKLRGATRVWSRAVRLSNVVKRLFWLLQEWKGDQSGGCCP